LMIKRYVFLRIALIVSFLCIVLPGHSYSQEKKGVLYQVSTINALLEGVYDGDISYGELKKHGDFGIGTFNGLDGEMIGLDGKFFQIKSDGRAYPVDEVMKTPFAVVTFFEPDQKHVPDRPQDCGQLQEYLDSVLPTKNIFYAFRVKGLFKHVKTRSVPQQSRPYRRLTDVVKDQPVFEFNMVRGSIVGVRFPEYFRGINMPGYHMHFITEERNAGGHLLACVTQGVLVEVMYSKSFYLLLPGDGDFARTELLKAEQGELEKVEK